jgi:hypothetical protein
VSNLSGAARHFITKCSCGAVIAQCRCPSRDKIESVLRNGCPSCKAKTGPGVSFAEQYKEHPLNAICASCDHAWQYHSFIKPHACLAGRDIDVTKRTTIVGVGACNCPAFVDSGQRTIEGDALVGAALDIMIDGLSEVQQKLIPQKVDLRAEIEHLQNQITLLVPYCLAHVKDGEGACQTAARLLRDGRATREQLAILALGMKVLLSEVGVPRTRMIQEIGTSEELFQEALEAGLQLAREYAT